MPLSNTFDGWRAEVNAAIADLNPQINGLNALISLQNLFSANALAALSAKRDVRIRRRDLLATSLSDLDQLEDSRRRLVADGYPDLTNPTVDPAVIAELEQEEGFIEAALNEFGITTTSTSNAQTLSISLGSPAVKS